MVVQWFVWLGEILCCCCIIINNNTITAVALTCIFIDSFLAAPYASILDCSWININQYTYCSAYSSLQSRFVFENHAIIHFCGSLLASFLMYEFHCFSIFGDSSNIRIISNHPYTWAVNLIMSIQIRCKHLLTAWMDLIGGVASWEWDWGNCLFL